MKVKGHSIFKFFLVEILVSAIWVYIVVITLVIPILPMVGNMRITNLEGIPCKAMVMI